MTGSDRHDGRENHLLATIDEAANRGRLGARRSVYEGARSESQLGCAVSAAVVLGGIGIVLVVMGQVGLAIFPFGLLAICLGAAWIESSSSKKNRGSRIDLFEQGLTVALKDRVHTVRYDITSVHQRSTKYTGAGGRTDYEYTLVDTDNDRVVLRGRSDATTQKGGFRYPLEWGPAIQQGVTQAQSPQALARLRSGESLSFGKLSLTQYTVGGERDSVQWSEVQDIKVFDGFVKIKVAGKWRSLANVAVSSIPNFFLFLALADHLRQPGR